VARIMNSDGSEMINFDWLDEALADYPEEDGGNDAVIDYSGFSLDGGDSEGDIDDDEAQVDRDGALWDDLT